MKRSFVCSVFVLASLWGASALADEWPGWRGAQRDDISRESGLLLEWPEDGPKRLWLYENAGLGYAGFAVDQDVVYTMGTRDGRAILLALQAATGQELWATPFGEIFTNRWGDGPRSTPSVVGPHVYATASEGILVCCTKADGKIVWQRDFQEFGGKVPQWGFASSPLIDGEKIIVAPGGPDGVLVALDRRNGEIVWQTTEVGDSVHYSSPIKIEHEGKPQYVQLTKSWVSGFGCDSGELLWQSEWSGRIAVIPTPIFHKGHIFVSSGYGVGCKLISIDGGDAKELYANKSMVNHHGGVILVGEHLYGYSDGKGWVCQDFVSGEIVWQEKDKLGKGAISCAGDRLYLLEEETGQVVLITPTPEGWQEHGRFTLSPQTRRRKPSGKIWTHPVIANGRLFLRDQELIYCFDVRQ